MKDQSSDSDSEEEESKSNSKSQVRQTYHNINGQFVPQSEFNMRQNSADQWARKSSGLDKT
jgi:hypothetical protein